MKLKTILVWLIGLDVRAMKGLLQEYLDSVGETRFYECYRANLALPIFKAKLKLTRRCNLQCVKCNYWRRIVRDELTTDEVLSVIDQLSEMGCRTIKFSGGEVLLRKDIFALLKHAKERGIATSITSNGTLIDKTTASKLVRSGLDSITISIDSHEPETHDKIVGVRGSWKRSTAAIKNLKESSKMLKRDLIIALQSVVLKSNYHKLPEIIKLANKLNINKLSLLSFVDHHLKDKGERMNRNDLAYSSVHLLRELYDSAGELGVKIVNYGPLQLYPQHIRIDNNILKTDIYSKIPCFVPWMNVYISSNGDVYACCSSKLPSFRMGNIRTSRLDYLANSMAFRDFRKSSKPPINRRICGLCLNEIKLNKTIYEKFKHLIA